MTHWNQHELGCGVVVLAMVAAAPLGAQQAAVVCASQGRAQFCPADTGNGVLLLHEQSRNVCRLGKTWRYDGKGIHVSDGCQAEFLVHPKDSGAPGTVGYKTHGTGVDAYHTNGRVMPRDAGTADDTGASSTGSTDAPGSTPQPK